ncbi:MAG: hypothetical protein J1F68_02510 [Clostridiales bacterium]|nr:hypothetical protein [Clostridiales bacterium]
MKKTIFLLAALMICMTLCLAACGPIELSTKPLSKLNPDPIDDNNRVFYQIFVGSFSDSDGDGIGDIRGIINRMNYINDGDYTDGRSLGVQGIWLSPIFTSPSYHKYDAIDYYEVDSQFGTLDDLKELLDICHKRNVKVILDLAINHSSNQNQWFKDFCSARNSNNTSSPYYDFYTCYDRNDPEKPAKNTLSAVPGSSKWVYECNFSGDMPELNYDNPAVRAEMLNVAKYWLDIGVDGFRFDAVKYIYYNDNASSVDFWKWYMSELKKIKPDIYTVGECWDDDSVVLQYYEALSCFNFTVGGANGRILDAIRSDNINAYTNYVANFLSSMKEQNSDGMFMPFLANHDMDRAAGYLLTSNGSAYIAANMYILCAGSPVIYYGEEIGMKGSRGGDNTDANRRLAMLWGDKDTVQDPIGSTYDSSKQTNGTVKQQLHKDNSLLEHYIKLIALRNKYPEIARGDYTALKINSSTVGGYSITYNNSTIGLFHNTSMYETIEIILPNGFTELADFIGLGKASVSNGVLSIGPNTSVIVR